MITPRCAFCAAVALAVSLPVSADPVERDIAAEIEALPWRSGPTTGALGDIATIAVPTGYKFVGRNAAGQFMELMENPSDGAELGVLLNTGSYWFVVFEFSSEGYVKDDDRNLDADSILASIREGTAAANRLRRERGWATIDVQGWQQRPFYDPHTNNLTWAIRGTTTEAAGTTINHSTRLLGRRGVMKVNLVLSPEDVGDALPAFNSLMGGFSYNAGQRYAEFTRGDKVAQYGLAGLIVGGAGVALAKTGVLQKFLKFIIVGVIALIAVIKRLLTAFGSRRRVDTAT